MSTKKGQSYGVDHHFSNYGNTHEMVMKHTITAADVDADVIRMGRVSTAFEYTSVEVCRNAAIGSASVDVGIINKETGAETPDFFKAAVATASAGRGQAINVPMMVEDHHDLTLKLNGAPTVGAVVYVIARGEHNGA